MFSWFQDPLPVGSAAPPFILPDEEGSVFVLNLNRNKFVVLVFYPGDDTSICTEQLCEFRDQWEPLRAKGAYVVGINPAGADSHKSFRKKHAFPYPLLVDNAKRVAKLYNCDGPAVKRTVYVIGRDGKILYSKRGKPPIADILAAIPAAQPAAG